MRLKTASIALLALSLALPMAAQAHRAWLLPAATVLSGEAPWVTVDAAVSNDIFHINYRAMALDNIRVRAPDGGDAAVQQPRGGKQRSSFDLQLTQPGTYKIFMASSGLRARWETEDGERRFWPGRGETPAPGEFAKAVPKQAKNLHVSYSSRRMETFVTSGQPDTAELAVQGEGLEMQPITHPNDLFAGETARFRLLIDGDAAAGAKVTVIPGAMRYRNSQEAITAVADAEGLVSITWPSAGMYYLEAEYEDERAPAPASQRQGSYSASFEVLPQ